MLSDMARRAFDTPIAPLVQHEGDVHPVIQTGEAWFVSVDLGQQADPSALALIRQTKVTHGHKRLRYYDIPLLHRWQLKTPYDLIVDDVVKMFATLPELNQSDQRQTLVVDMTGVGRAV